MGRVRPATAVIQSFAAPTGAGRRPNPSVRQHEHLNVRAVARATCNLQLNCNDAGNSGDDASFESHICYGSRPVIDPKTGIIREYYFGGGRLICTCAPFYTSSLVNFMALKAIAHLARRTLFVQH
eukprot:COSAG02_NODE_20651_length_821_cov_0.814404_1_plen_125_part_01